MKFPSRRLKLLSTFSFISHLQSVAVMIRKCLDKIPSTKLSIRIGGALVLYVILYTIVKPKCGCFPSEKDILIDNVMWQILELEVGFLKLLNAYYDSRWNGTFVKINVNGPEINIQKHKIFCQFWIDEGVGPIVVEASKYQVLMDRRERKNYQNSCFQMFKVLFRFQLKDLQ